MVFFHGDESHGRRVKKLNTRKPRGVQKELEQLTDTKHWACLNTGKIAGFRGG